MTYSFHRLIFLFVFIPALLTLAGCPFKSKPADSKVAPAVVSNAVKETELATVTLSEDAVRRLNVETAPVLEKTVQRTRSIGGEIITPPGLSVMVTAPWSGTLSSGNPDKPLSPGMAVQQGETVFMLQPVLSAEVQRIQLPQMLLDARQRVEAAQIEWDAANLEWNRAKQLLEDKAGSRQEADKAEAKVKLAQQALESAKSNLGLLTSDRLQTPDFRLQEDASNTDPEVRSPKPEAFSPLPIVAPVSGILNHFTAVAGQTVVQGSVLFDIVNTDQFWVRVPVYVGQLRDVYLEGAAQVYEYGQTDRSVVGSEYRNSSVIAQPVTAPPSANPNAATVDLYYRLQASGVRLQDEAASDNSEAGSLKSEAWSWIRPGHKVAVRLPVSEEETRLTIPWSSVVFDIYGGSWVYQQTDERTYSRQRVEIEYVRETAEEGSGIAVTRNRSEAVLRRGPSAGTLIVVTGVAEIWGTEFGGGK